MSGTYEIRVGDGATAGETRGKSTTGFGATLLGGGCAINTGWDPPNTLGDGNVGGSGAGGLWGSLEGGAWKRKVIFSESPHSVAARAGVKAPGKS